jgi:hypothetical protein
MIANSLLNHQGELLRRSKNVSVIYCDGEISLDSLRLNDNNYAIYVSPRGHMNLYEPRSAQPTNPALALPATRENPYRCGYCAGSFDSKMELNEHIEEAHPKCSLCQGKFPSQAEVDNHIKAAHPGCSWCYQTFPHTSYTGQSCQ